MGGRTRPLSGSGRSLFRRHPSSRFFQHSLITIGALMSRLLLLMVLLAANASAQITLEIKDYVALPITGLVDGKNNYDALLARVSGLREEPGGANRLFVPDLNGPLYIVDKDTKKLTVYLEFNGREGKSGIFHKLFME